jgi:hypothetical protein
MSKSRNKLKTLLFSTFMLLVMGLFAQVDKLDRARQLLQAKDINNAMLAIDSVIKHPDTKNDFTAWTIRAFIYFEKYKQTDRLKLNFNSALRDTVISSIKKSNSLKPDADFAANNKKIITSISAGYYNQAKSLLQDSLNEVRSLKAYNKYREIFLIGEPTADLTAKDIEYNLAVGSIFSDMFIRDNTNVKAQNTAKTALQKVLDKQPDNASANINMGLMYFNNAVNLTKSLGYDADISQVNAVQENIVKLAKQSEQYIYKVYKNDNKNSRAVLALYYIYRMLFDIKKSDEFKQKCKELNISLD